MTASDQPGHDDHVAGARQGAGEQEDGSVAERRPRTAYLWYRRYRRLGQLAFVAGGVAGALLSGAALLPPLLAGEQVPPGSFLVAALLVAAFALMPYLAVRWRWRVWRRRLEEE